MEPFAAVLVIYCRLEGPPPLPQPSSLHVLSTMSQPWFRGFPSGSPAGRLKSGTLHCPRARSLAESRVISLDSSSAKPQTKKKAKTPAIFLPIGPHPWMSQSIDMTFLDAFLEEHHESRTDQSHAFDHGGEYSLTASSNSPKLGGMGSK
jgi:hypothetical protein